MIVHEEEARGGIASDIDIRPSIVVVIGGNHGHAVAVLDLPSPSFADIGERPVAVVVVKRVPCRGKTARAAVDRDALPVAVDVWPGLGMR